MSAPAGSTTVSGAREASRPTRSVQSTWIYTLGSIVLFFVVLNAVLLLTMLVNFGESESILDAAIMISTLIAAAVQVRFCWFLRAGRGSGLPEKKWVVALFVPAAVAWVLGLFSPGAGLFTAVPLWMAINAAAPLLSTSRRWASLLGGVLLTVAHPLVASTVFDNSLDALEVSRLWMTFVYCVLLPIIVLSGLWWWEIVVRLDRHRSLAADLAVTEERLRFASDLHDIQGHHLQVIALKSELAERTLASDPDSAREHIHEVRLIAKQAMEETRALVAGYRVVALDQELENAREVLTAAGARCDLSIGRLPDNADTKRVLALVVREATTNILRHSDATRVRIRLYAADSGDILEIGNDGVVEGGASGRAASSGLEGLRGRVGSLGGIFDAQLDDSGTRFDLRVSIPSRARGDA